MQNIIKWLAEGETGVSSKTMAFTALGQEYRHPSHPHDPSDFNRCLKLVKAAPEVREAFPKIAAISKKWAKVIEHWDAIEAIFIEEVGFDWCKGRNIPARKTYDMMKGLGL